MNTVQRLGSLALAACLLCVSPAGTAQQKLNVGGLLELRQVTYTVADLEKTSRFVSNVLGWTRRRPGSTRGDAGGSAESAFFEANGVWIELRPSGTATAPSTKPPGAIVELNFWTREYDAVLDSLKASGVQVVDGANVPPRHGEPKVTGRSRTQQATESRATPRVAYLPMNLSGATRIGIIDAAGRATPGSAADTRSLLDRAAPRVSHVAILVEDLDSAASVYTGLLKLRRSSRIFEIDAETNPEIGGMKLNFIRTGGPWLELVAPVGPGPIATALAHEGNGAAAELVVEVDDLDQYFDHLKGKGIVLTDIDGTPLGGDRKSRVIAPFGTKIAYVPTEASQGMVIEIIERGPRDTDILHLRDAE